MRALVWRTRLREVRQEHPRWGAKKLRRLLPRAFPEARHVPAVSTLSRWLAAALGKEAAAAGAARTSLALEGSTRAKRLQRNVHNRLQRLVSHGRWTALRTAYCARSVQSFCAGG